MRVLRIGNSERWRCWAHSLARRPVVRRRSPVTLALVRRRRLRSLTPAGGRLIHHNHAMVSNVCNWLPVYANLCFAWNIGTGRPAGQRPLSRAEAHASAPGGGRQLPVPKSAAGPLVFAPQNVTRAAARGSWPSVAGTLFAPPSLSVALGPGSTQTLLRSMMERTRRIEHRVSVQTRVVSKAPPPAPQSQPLDSRISGKSAGPGAAEGPLQTASANRALRFHGPLAALSLEQVTENVLHQLDRRITAWRERLGRT